jgi:thiosulfate dehydrogenase (quinone) large subunit
MSGSGRHSAGRYSPSLLRGWKTQPLSLTVLRGFLGVTFLYAGIQKLADPAFFASGSPTYIGSQLQGFSRGSPIGPLLLLLARAPVAAGILVALTEIAIGLATLLGIGMLAAAAAGSALSAMLWLSASWHVYPYFLGSDSIYAVAWLALGLAVWEMGRRRQAAAKGSSKAKRVESAVAWEPSRRDFIRGGALSLLTLVAGGAAWALAGSSPVRAATADPLSSASASRRGGTSGTDASAPAVSSPVAPPAASGGGAAPAAPPPPSGVQIASFDRLAVGDAVPFDAPGVGACALVRTGEKTCEAYSRTCTHQGCEVGWNSSAGLLVCPCHGAEFDPAQGGKPVAGPAYRPLESVKVVVDGSTGGVYLPQ